MVVGQTDVDCEKQIAAADAQLECWKRQIAAAKKAARRVRKKSP